jgi:hypothetical protein
VLLGLVWRGLSAAGCGRLLVRAAGEGDAAVLVVEHGGGSDPALGWMIAVAEAAASEMGGAFDVRRGDEAERVELRLRRGSAA